MKPSLITIGVAVLACAALPARAIENHAAERFERQFLEGMIHHHAIAVDMALTCLERGGRAELRELCTEIIRAQEQEIEVLRSWLYEWYGVAVHTPGDPGLQHDIGPKLVECPNGHLDVHMLTSLDPARLQGLEGDQFDHAFMAIMTEHHEDALRQAGLCLGRATHPELTGLCEDIITTQGREVAQMDLWLASWFDACVH